MVLDNEDYVASANRYSGARINTALAVQLDRANPQLNGAYLKEAQKLYRMIFDAFEAGVAWEREKNRLEMLALIQGRIGFKLKEGEFHGPEHSS